MKAFVFQGGLGNQIFEYAYYNILRKSKPNLGYIFPKGNNHNGFELDKWFDVSLTKGTFFDEWFYPIAKKMKELGIINLIANKDVDPLMDKYYITGYFQNKSYLSDNFIQFRKIELSEENQHFLNLMKSTESIALHIRRGDYLVPPFDSIYGGICTEMYYKKAIKIAEKLFNTPSYFIFSNDMDWVKENFQLNNAFYVECNTGKNSPVDMYLMTHAKANIIANSSFSFWGAYLNKGKSLVVYPKKWFNSKYSAPDIFPQEWIGI